jgi:hypothetical protein
MDMPDKDKNPQRRKGEANYDPAKAAGGGKHTEKNHPATRVGEPNHGKSRDD